MKLRSLLLVLIIFQISGKLCAQEYKHLTSFNFNVNEGMLQSTIMDIAFDRDNFLWISYPNGIQRFDGVNFTSVPIQPGLPDDKWAFFQELPSGNLLISHTKGVSLFHLPTHSFRLVVRWATPVLSPISFLGYYEGVFYMINNRNEVIGFDKDYKVVLRKKIMIPNVQLLDPISANMLKIVDHAIVGCINGRVYKWDLKSFNVINESETLGKNFFSFLGVCNSGEPLYTVFKNDSLYFFKYNFKDRESVRIYAIFQKSESPIIRGNVFVWQGKQMVSFSDRIFELDNEHLTFKYELRNMKGETFTGGRGISSIAIDRFGSLYLQSVNNGIAKLVFNNFPFQYYGSYNLKDNFALTVFADKPSNRILIGVLSGGLYIYDTTQQLLKKWQKFPGWPSKVSPTRIVKAPSGGYYIFSNGCAKIHFLSPDLNEVQEVKANWENGDEFNIHSGYYSNYLFQDRDMAIVQTENLIFTINFHNKSVMVRRIPGGAVIAGLYVSPNLIVSRSDSLLFYDIARLSLTKSVYFPNTGGTRCFLKSDSSGFYVGTNKGVFKVDNQGRVVQHWDKQMGLPDECIYSMVKDESGELWCSSNRGIFKIGKEKSVLQINQDDGLQGNEFNTNSSFKSMDGEMYFGGVNGVNAFYPSSILERKDSIHLLFTNILINNARVSENVQDGNLSLQLPYNKNSLSFDFHAMSAGNPEQYAYQYRMIGFDENWIKNSGTQTVRYYLSPGKYKFQIYASRAFDAHATPQKEIDIVIHPPYWQSWWFAVAISLIVLMVTGYIFRLIYRNRYEKQMLRLQAEKDLQIERERISRDLHDSIGAYANTVLYKAQILQSEAFERKELLDDLRFASKDIITSLRETIWALKNENFAAQDCLIRIRNFVQSMNKYYQQIHFSVSGEAPLGKWVPSAKALNLVRIIQESITNSIKHSHCKNILLSSAYTDLYWELKMEDDGDGFNLEAEQEKDEGNGLRHMAERAKEEGFEFLIHSQPGRGSSVVVRMKFE